MSINNLSQSDQSSQFQEDWEVNPDKKVKRIAAQEESDSHEMRFKATEADHLFRQARDLINFENQVIRKFRKACQGNNVALIKTIVSAKDHQLDSLDFYINALERVKEEPAKANFIRNSLMKTKERLESIQIPEEMGSRDMLDEM